MRFLEGGRRSVEVYSQRICWPSLSDNDMVDLSSPKLRRCPV
jgi:hypothetical protein